MVERRHPEWFLLAAISGAIVAVSVSSLPLLAAIGGGVSALLLVARPSLATLRARLGGILPIAIVAGALRAFSLHSWQAGLFVVLRIAIASSFATWLSASLSASDIERALARIGVPDVLVELLTMTRRFGLQLKSTLASSWIAVALRGGFRSRRRMSSTLGLVAGVVVVRALDRSRRVAVARSLRGHDLALEAPFERAASPR
ncbi:MAG TPA: energy-coupling factor transporter transmembrane component T [Polyangiales bacterium]|nr:energy-coupling factor transporter transmembrane component T [Polyangiales bacterium]